jgi:hypothetical protein
VEERGLAVPGNPGSVVRLISGCRDLIMASQASRSRERMEPNERAEISVKAVRIRTSAAPGHAFW